MARMRMKSLKYKKMEGDSDYARLFNLIVTHFNETWVTANNISEICGYSETTIREFLKQRTVPSVTMVFDLCEALGIEVKGESGIC